MILRGILFKEATGRYAVMRYAENKRRGGKPRGGRLLLFDPRHRRSDDSAGPRRVASRRAESTPA